MASTGAVIYVHPRLLSSASVNRQSGAVVYYAFRQSSGFYAAGAGVDTTQTDTQNKAWLPPAQVPVVDQSGRMTGPWYRFFDYLANRKVGRESPTVGDLVSSVESSQAAVTAVVATVQDVADTTLQNAQSLATTVEVVRNNSLAGASQIPQAKLSLLGIDRSE